MLIYNILGADDLDDLTWTLSSVCVGEYSSILKIYFVLRTR